MMTDQQFVKLCEAARRVLREAGVNALQVTGQQAYEAVVLYAGLMAHCGDEVWQRYLAERVLERERGAFFNRWDAWQQEERHRLGCG
jgi:hypothetical protein